MSPVMIGGKKYYGKDEWMEFERAPWEAAKKRRFELLQPVMLVAISELYSYASKCSFDLIEVIRINTTADLMHWYEMGLPRFACDHKDPALFYGDNGIRCLRISLAHQVIDLAEKKPDYVRELKETA